MLADDLEFSISQYADGTLPAGERAALEDILRRDSAARALLAEYRRLDGALKAAVAPVVDWDGFAGRVGDAIVRAGDATLPGDFEFALAQWADGTLAEVDRPAVEARLAADAVARGVVSDAAAVDTFIRQAAGPLPAVRWDALADAITAAVDRGVASASVSEDAEFVLAQYADGTLADDRRGDVESRLAADPAARLAVADYAGLDALLKSAPLPSVAWDRLAGHLSAAVARDAGDSRSFKLWAWARSPIKLGLAASVVVAAGIGLRLSRPAAVPKPVDQPAAVARIDVDVAGPEVAAGAAVADITIGPPPAGGGNFAAADGTGGVVTRPTRAIVAGGATAFDEGTGQPF